MKHPIDIHTHTIHSDHAYSTLSENAKYASEIGLKVLGTSDHGPAMPGAPYYWHFGNFRVLPRKLYGVTMLYGCEANIMDYDGKIDLPFETQKRLDYMIISMHDPLMKTGVSAELNTKAYLNAMENPNVCVIGHAGNPAFPVNAEELVRKAKEKNILIEINNSSIVGIRVGSEKNCKEIALLCKKYGVSIIINSDAHWFSYIGGFSAAEKMLNEIDFPEELIINNDEDKLLSFLISKGKDIKNR